MTKISVSVFWVTFILGMIAVVSYNVLFCVKSERTDALPSVNSKRSAEDAAEGSALVFDNPLRLPNSAKVEYRSKEGWEYSGTVNANFVSARAQLDSWMQNQGWSPEKKITLDENIEPKIILTFMRGSEVMTVFIWKISTMSTGFAYKRESENKKESVNEFR